MKVTINSKKGLSTELKVFVDREIINKKINFKLQELKDKVSIKGFRPGKVPLNVLKMQFGKSIYGEILQQILQETSTQALKEKKIRSATQPKIDLKIYGEDKNLEYLLKVEELPKIEVNEVKDLKITEYQIEVLKKDVEKRLEEISKQQSNFKDKAHDAISQDGDLIIFDYDATVEGKSFEGSKGKNVQLILGKDLFIKGFDKQLIGIKKNQQKEAEVTLPSNYPKKELSNKKAKFDCKILNIKKPEKIVVDDEFAKNFGAKDLNNLKDMLKKQIQAEYLNALSAVTKKEILNQLESFKNIELPKNLIDQEIAIIEENMTNEEKEKNKKDNEKNAKKRVKIGLILNEFGEQNKLKVSDDEVKVEIQKQIQSMPGQAKQVTDFYEKNQSAVASLRGNIYEDKIINLIRQKCKVTKKIVNTHRASEIILKNGNASNKISKTASKPKVVIKKNKTTRSSKKPK